MLKGHQHININQKTCFLKEIIHVDILSCFVRCCCVIKFVLFVGISSFDVMIRFRFLETALLRTSQLGTLRFTASLIWKTVVTPLDPGGLKAHFEYVMLIPRTAIQ